MNIHINKGHTFWVFFLMTLIKVVKRYNSLVHVMSSFYIDPQKPAPTVIHHFVWSYRLWCFTDIK